MSLELLDHVPEDCKLRDDPQWTVGIVELATWDKRRIEGVSFPLSEERGWWNDAIKKARLVCGICRLCDPHPESSGTHKDPRLTLVPYHR